MKQKILVILLHLFAWFTFLSVPYMFRPDHRSFERVLADTPTQTYQDREGVIQDILLPQRLAYGFLFIAIFYANYLFIMPQYYRKRRHWLPVLFIGLSIAFLFLVNYLIRPPGLAPGDTAYAVLGPSHHLFMLIIVIVVSFMLSFYEQIRKMEQERLQGEISFLKSQINPHFLFNTLNSIYSLSLTQSEKTPDAIVKFSSLFRYFIGDTDRAYVPLQEELQYISDYIALQRLRLTEKVELEYVQSGDASNCEIIPFALIPFIENAFRYGVNPEENSRIGISIAIEEGVLRMTVSNNKVHVEKNGSLNPGSRIGNIAERLRCHYPKKHVLEFTDENGVFQVRLTVDLKRAK